ncbi:M1 family metallopeptidase [Pendulispora albinea]|uniref:Membrane alanyl aminopeptidase n=1 Tax=Pendulispora albinea TaxID=2741071 RepID=A0ABZ2LWA4_9BACT
MTNVALRATMLALASFALCHCDDSSGGSNGRDGGGGGPDASTLDAGALDAGGSDGGDGGVCADCNGTRAYDAQSYSLRGKFDWSARKLIAEEEITVTLTTEYSVVALDAALTVKRVSAGGNDLKWAYDTKERVLHVDLGPLRKDGRVVTFVVSYEAPVSSSLVASKGRDGDPVASRVVFTNSEPDRARNWLVSNDHPSDRARWSVELTVGADEDVIANGQRVRDERSGESRTVGHRMSVPLPTYLMAFAGGQLEHADDDKKTARFPLSVWHRRGLMIDTGEHLKLLADLTKTFETLIGPYPFEDVGYSVVLLPDFSGGMENATVTFNAESSGQGTLAFNLNAHEYAHHWFGDWVTMRDYDDAWVKEGMATLMATEASRAFEDTERTGRLLGSDFAPKSSASVVDKTLKGSAKYTSGPYDRAAWMITQIRAKLSDDKVFWKSLRDMLAAHGAGTINGEEFVRSFPLDEATVQKVLATLEKKPMPTVAIETRGADAGAARSVTLTLGDPSSALLEPIPVTVIGETGKVEREDKLEPGKPLTFDVPAGGYLAYDERDVNPDWDESFDGVRDVYKTKLLPLMVPSSPAALETFATRSATHQARVLSSNVLPPISGDQLADLHGKLDSRFAKRSAEIDGCQSMQRVANEGGDTRPWAISLESLLKTPALTSYSTGYGSCTPGFVSGLFGEEPKRPITAQNLGRATYLLGFDYGPDESFALGKRLATEAPALVLRELAVRRLASQAAGAPYSIIPADKIPAWKDFFRARLDESTSQTRFRYVWEGIRALKDDGAFPSVALKLHALPLSAATQHQTICEAYRVVKDDTAARDRFREAAKPWGTLTPLAAEVLQDPSKCPAPSLAPLASSRGLPLTSDAKGAREDKR